MKLTLIYVALLFVFGIARAHGAVSLDDNKGDTTFRVNGETVSADDAVKAAVAGQDVSRCKPKSLNAKKVYYTSSGTATAVIECTAVELKVNPKTGSPKWSVIK